MISRWTRRSVFCGISCFDAAQDIADCYELAHRHLIDQIAEFRTLRGLAGSVLGHTVHPWGGIPVYSL
jgi:hypothetical protein